MRSFCTTACLTLLLVVTTGRLSQAQPPPPRPRHDTLTLEAWRAEMLKAPVITGGTQARIIVPNREPFCFDKMICLKLMLGGRMTEQTMYLDTRAGIAGVLKPSVGNPIRDILPDDPKFFFGVIGLKGNIYNYKNEKGKLDVIEHWVSTGNSQTYQTQTLASPGPAAGVDLVRKAESRQYIGGKITAQAYRYGGGPNTWYVYGDRYPEKLHPVKYLGSFGVGYLATQEGLYLVMERVMGSITCQISDMDNVHTCFDPTPFRIKEDAFQAERQADLQNESARLDREQAGISGDCTAEKTALLNYKRELQRLSEDALRKSREGNLYSDTAAQRAMLSMMDPIYSVREAILSNKVGICGAHTVMAKAQTPQATRAAQARLDCLGAQQVTLQNVLSQMEALDHQYANQPARANPEKSKLYMAAMRELTGCN